MKINFFMLLVAIVVGLLLYFGFHHYYGNVLYSVAIALIGFLMFGTAAAVHLPTSHRSAAMLKVASAVFFFILLITDILFALFSISDAMFIIMNGLIVCFWAMSVYSIARARQ